MRRLSPAGKKALGRWHRHEDSIALMPKPFARKEPISPSPFRARKSSRLKLIQKRDRESASAPPTISIFAHASGNLEPARHRLEDGGKRDATEIR
mgnify:CR=1 FL=1